MKPFDLEKAKNGAAVCLSDGSPVKILDFDFNGDILYKFKDTDHSGITVELTVLVGQDGKRGKHNIGYDWKKLDLYMAPVVAYMNVYRDKDNECLRGGRIYASEEDCETAKKRSHSSIFFCKAKIELLDE